MHGLPGPPWHANLVRGSSIEVRCMQTDYTYVEDKQILVVHPTGVVVTSSWPLIIGQSIDEGRKYACTRFLFDQRDAEIRITLAQLFAMPKNEGTFKQPMNARVALLLHPIPLVERKFIETFNSNRGFNLKVFHDEDLAIAWLEANTPAPNT